MTHFGSVARLKQASVEEITSVPGIGVATAKAVLAALGVATDRHDGRRSRSIDRNGRHGGWPTVTR